VPAQPLAAWELGDVPHGTVVTAWQPSTVLQRTERSHLSHLCRGSYLAAVAPQPDGLCSPAVCEGALT
jgi:hypothetical protein